MNTPDSGDRRFPRSYRRLWWSTAAGLAVVGSVVSLLSIRPTLLIFVVAGSLMVVGSVGGMIQQAMFGEVKPARLVTMIIIIIPTSTAIAGWVALIGGWALLLTVLLGAAQPSVAGYLLLRVGRRIGERMAREDHPRRGYPSPTAPPVTPTPTPTFAVWLPSTALTEIGDRELCNAWRVSYVVLQRLQKTSDIPAQSRLVGLRQLYLDEMERRHPQEFARWLLGGARPASDPSRHLLPTRASRPGEA